ncbi:hypothetical protein M0R45_018624 [Rubus argutus]|uniref:Uncharacterized protein n=1 Tax=Rubus argutus TaxID=59490 RepID=A0AAW1X3Y4_RUBAR
MSLSSSSSSINNTLTDSSHSTKQMQNSNPPPLPPPAFISAHRRPQNRPRHSSSALPFLPSSLFLTLSSSLSPYSYSLLLSSSSPHIHPTRSLPDRQSHRVIYHDNNSSDPPPPSIAYLLSAFKRRLGSDRPPPLRHLPPQKPVLLHLDRFASNSDREAMARKVHQCPFQSCPECPSHWSKRLKPVIVDPGLYLSEKM